MEAKKYLTELINYERDIAPYKAILIKAPVGSGKNVFMGKLALGEIPGSDNPCVLLVTSRRGVVDQALNDEALLAVFSKCKGLGVDDGQLWQTYQLATMPDGEARYCREDNRHSCVMTMAQLTSIYDKLYRLGPEIWEQYKLWPWMLFDVLVLDEIHALLMDATFADAPPHIMDMLELFVRSDLLSNKKVIMQSATTDCIEQILKQKLGKLHIVSKMTQAKSVLPQAITWTSETAIKQDILKKVRSGEKVIYFYVGDLMQVDKFLGAKNTDLLDVSVSIFSDAEAMSKLEETNIRAYQKTKEVLDSVAKDGILPDWTKLVIATAKWKEGLNLKNPDIKWVFLDTHVEADLLQYCGRVRKAPYTLVLCHDADQKTYNTLCQLQTIEDEKGIIASENESLSTESAEEKFKHIDAVEKSHLWIDGKSVPNADFRGFTGIYFDWFSGQFKFNSLMWESLQYRLRCIRAWENLNKASSTSYSDFVRKIFHGQITAEKLLLPEYQAKVIYKSFKFEEGKVYSPEKITNFITAVKEQIWPNVKRVNDIMKHIQYSSWYHDKPILQFEIIKTKKKNGHYRLIRKTVKKPKSQ